MQLFHVGLRHVLWHRWSLFSLAWQKRFSCKGRELKIYSCGFTLLSEPWIWVFHAFICQTMSNNYIKACSTIIYAPLTKSNHWFVALLLQFPFSFHFYTPFCLGVVSIRAKHSWIVVLINLFLWFLLFWLFRLWQAHDLQVENPC